MRPAPGARRCDLLLFKERVDEGVGVEVFQIVDLLADTYELDGQAEFLLDG